MAADDSFVPRSGSPTPSLAILADSGDDAAGRRGTVTTADWGDVQPEHKWGVELDENSHRAIDIYDNALLLVAIAEYLETVCGADAARKEKWTGRGESLRKAVREHLWDKTAGKFVPHL